MCESVVIPSLAVSEHSVNWLKDIFRADGGVNGRDFKLISFLGESKQLQLQWIDVGTVHVIMSEFGSEINISLRHLYEESIADFITI
jgi:hypothetical protein